MIYIYALVDPVSRKIRYIGRTNDPQRRLQQHLGNYHRKDSYCQRWIQSVLKQGKKPRLRIIEECDEDVWRDREQYWIAFYRAKGYLLTNITDGGDGVYPISLEKEVQRREGISSSRRGMRFSDDHRKNLSLSANLKFKNNPDLKKNLANKWGVLTDKQVLEVWELANSGKMLSSEIAERYKIPQSTVSEIKNGKRYVHVVGKLASKKVDVKALRSATVEKRCLESYLQGMSIEQIAEIENILPASVRNRLKKSLGMPVATYESRKRKQQALELYKQGKSYEEIGGLMGTSRHTAWAILNRKRASDFLE